MLASTRQRLFINVALRREGCHRLSSSISLPFFTDLLLLHAFDRDFRYYSAVNSSKIDSLDGFLRFIEVLLRIRRSIPFSHILVSTLFVLPRTAASNLGFPRNSPLPWLAPTPVSIIRRYCGFSIRLRVFVRISVRVQRVGSSAVGKSGRSGVDQSTPCRAIIAIG